MATKGEGERIGAARVDITMDTTELELGIQRANERIAQMAAGAQEQYGKMNKAERQRIDSLTRQADKIGLNRQQQLAYDISMRTSGKVREDLLRKVEKNTVAIQAENAAMVGATKTFNAYGLSAKQQVAAMRQVPAQMTDIFVSLQGGQNPMTVLIQQGGQLKDVFGGIRPAAAALAQGLSSLINPYTALAAVVGTVGVAALQSANETSALEKALASTGGIAGVTGTQLQTLVSQLADGNRTYGETASALAEVVSSGKFTADQFGIVTAAAVDMERATGKAIDETIAQFASLAKDPVDAVAKLNESQRFLTLETYDYIKALVAQGDEQAAATVAMRAWAQEVQERASEVEGSLTGLEAGWRAVWRAAKDAWDVMRQAIKGANIKEQLRAIDSEIGEFEFGAGGSWLGRVENFFNNDQQDAARLARLQADRKRLMRQIQGEEQESQEERDRQFVQNAAISATQRAAGYRSAEQRYVDEREAIIAETQRALDIAEKRGMATEAQRLRDNIAQTNRYYDQKIAAERKKGSPKGQAGVDRAETRAGLQEFKDILAEKQAAIRQDTAILQAEYAAKLVTQQDYFAQQKSLAQREAAAEEEALVGQIAFLKTRNVTGREAIDVQRQLGQLEAQLAKTRIENATKMAVIGIQEDAYYRARKNAMDDYADAMELGTQALRDQVNAQIDRIRMSEREFELQQRVNAILREAADAERDLARAKRDGQISAAEYAQQSAMNAKAAQDRVNIEYDAIGQIEAAQQDWRAGIRAGLQDWVDQAGNAAEQARAATTKAMDALVGSIQQAALTGKMAWKQLLIDILSEISKFMIKKAVLGFIQMMMSMWGGGGTSATTVGTTGTGSNFAGFAAKGWVGSSPTLSDHMNTVIDKPTPFFFAKGGAFGIGGEAGPEAIMPLTRGADGTLGVRVHGGMGAASAVNLNIITNVASDGSKQSSSTTTSGDDANNYRRFAEMMGAVAQDKIHQAMRPGGVLWKARVSA